MTNVSIKSMIKTRGLLFFMTAMAFTACTSDFSDSDGSASKDEKVMGTEVYVAGKLLDGSGSRSRAYEGETLSRAAQGVNYADAYFFIRIDSRIPELVGNYNPNDYLPWNNGSVFKPENKGKVNLDYPYWNISSTYGVGKYLYDTSGKSVETIIDDVPTFASLMSVNKKGSALDANIDTENLKIIWYVAKYTFGAWHVDGVLTFKSTGDITEVPGVSKDPSFENKAEEPTPLPSLYGKGNIEVDIHQQEHGDWQEIKTSVHVRDLVEKVTVEIPLEYDNIAEADDFAIRTYDLELESKVFINKTEYTLDSTNPVKVTIEHQANKAVFTIVCTDEKYLQALRKEYGDGVTIEIHTYPKNISKEIVWTKLQSSEVKVSPSTYENLIFKGATSAFFTE